MLALIDNYDSFTYNLYQMLAVQNVEVRVVRNDEITLRQLIDWAPQRLMISPGPGRPESAGISIAAVQHFAGRIPVLGVCLGHQALAQAYGGEIVRAERIMHGKTSPIHHRSQGVFQGLPHPFEATRYHSLIVSKPNLSSDFEITAWTEEEEVMALRHAPTGAEGVQFHPESILTDAGTLLLENFVRC